MPRAMKDSGIKWIGVIPVEWNIVSIGRLFSISAGGDAKPEFYSDTQDDAHLYPVYTNSMNKNQVYAYTSKPIYSENTITVTGRGAIGTAFYRDTPYDAIIRLLSLSPKLDLDGRFYAYWISNVIHFFTDSATVGQLSSIQVSSYKTVYCSKEEQKRIADYLDGECARIDNVIEKTRASIVEYKKLKQAIITRAVTKGMRPARPMKDSGVEWLGDIPADWEICKLKYFLSADKVNLRVGPFGSALSGTDFTSEGFWVYNQRIVLDNNFSENNTFVSKEKYEELKGFEVLPGDVLITTRGSIGKVAIVPSTAEKGILHPCIIKFRVNEDLISHSLIWHIFNNTDIAMRQIKNMSNSTTIEVLYSYSLKNIQIPLIPKDEQKEIAQYLDGKTAAIDSLVAKKNRLAEELTSLKKSLIFEYVTGKKEVPT